jgi:hypothetical protein
MRHVENPHYKKSKKLSFPFSIRRNVEPLEIRFVSSAGNYVTKRLDSNQEVYLIEEISQHYLVETENKDRWFVAKGMLAPLSYSRKDIGNELTKIGYLVCSSCFEAKLPQQYHVNSGICKFCVRGY